MNDDIEDSNDETIRNLLAPLRAVHPSDEICLANRKAIRRALDRRALLPWWRRSVAVPMPVAIAASLALVITAAAAFWPAFVHTTAAAQSASEVESSVASDASTPQWRITQSYILSLESLAKLQSSIPPGMTEDHNDS